MCSLHRVWSVSTLPWLPLQLLWWPSLSSRACGRRRTCFQQTSSWLVHASDVLLVHLPLAHKPMLSLSLVILAGPRERFSLHHLVLVFTCLRHVDPSMAIINLYVVARTALAVACSDVPCVCSVLLLTSIIALLCLVSGLSAPALSCFVFYLSHVNTCLSSLLVCTCCPSIFVSVLFFVCFPSWFCAPILSLNPLFNRSAHSAGTFICRSRCRAGAPLALCIDFSWCSNMNVKEYRTFVGSTGAKGILAWIYPFLIRIKGLEQGAGLWRADLLFAL